MKIFMALLVLLGLVDLVKGAVVIPKTTAEFNTAMSSTTAWSVYLRAGTPATDSYHEIQVSKSGTLVETRNHLWHKPEPISLSYNLSGNLSLNVGSTNVTIQPTQPFNMIMIQIKDSNTGVTSFSNFVFDGLNIRDLVADDPTEMNPAYDNIGFSGLSNTFNFSGNWEMGKGGGDVAFTDSYMRVIGIQIPEPSSIVLVSLVSLSLLKRRR